MHREMSRGVVHRDAATTTQHHAMSFDRFPRSRARGGTRAGVARLPARHRHAGLGVRQAASAGRSRSCSSPRRPAARRGRATRSWAPSRAPRGGSRDGVVEDWTPAAGWHSARTPADPLARSRGARRAHVEPVDVPELGAFWSGAVGYFSYDVVRLIERLPIAAAARRSTCPTRCSCSPRAGDHRQSARAGARGGRRAGRRRRERRDAPARCTTTPMRDDRRDDRAPARGRAAAAARPRRGRRRRPTGTSTYARETIHRATSSASSEYIVAGDCFQALLARRITCRTTSSPPTLYRALRAINPSPYMYHLVLDGVELVGSSPELLVRVADGTRHRAADRRHAAARRDAAEDDAR